MYERREHPVAVHAKELKDMIVRTSLFRVVIHTTAAVAVAMLAWAAPADAQERFTAQAVNLSNVGGSGAVGMVDIIIDRYSTEEERNRFLAALTERGNDGLLEAFQNAPSIGRVGPTGRLGFDIRYAVEMPGEDGGRQIVIASDRRMSFLEASNRPRTVDYPFTVVQLKLDNSGKGEGKASVLTRIEADKRNNAIVLENFASRPVDLMGVRSLGGKVKGTTRR
jgi:hypothetical protein